VTDAGRAGREGWAAGSDLPSARREEGWRAPVGEPDPPGAPEPSGAGAAETARVEVEAGVDRALAAVGEAAEAWGADWQRDGRGGALLLPVTAGIRRGWVRGPLTATPAGRSTRLALAVEESRYHLHTAAVVILLLSAAGAVLTVVWPFVPALLPIAPLGAILALGGWFLVVSRLQNAGPEEFLEAVAESVSGPRPEGASPSSRASGPPPSTRESEATEGSPPPPITPR